jgi:radical SAM superfamily enzyme YgiQ (UPF0313 family)
MKILLTTEYRDSGKLHDYFGSNSVATSRFNYRLTQAYGLRFIKQNIPQVEILEFPTLEEYKSRLSEGWDAVGFSFFTQDIPAVLKMVELARDADVGQIWGGGYGAFNPAIEEYFDRVFVGNAEFEIAKAMGHTIDRLRHPPLIEYWSVRSAPFLVQRVAALFTSRGCANHCAFCQTPAFAPKPDFLPIESVDEVLRFYKNNGVDWLVIADENFGHKKAYAQQVLELLKKYGLFWSLQTTVKSGLRNLDEWCDANLMGIGIGVESVDQRVLDSFGKKSTFDDVLHLKEELYQRQRYLWSYYIIAHEFADYESTKEEIETLRKHKFGYCQVTALTPLPYTPVWDDIEKRFGIFEKDWSKFDTGHLVWNHPKLNAVQVDELLLYAYKRLNSSAMFFDFFLRIRKAYSANMGSYWKAWQLMSSFPFKSLRYPVPPPLL